MLRDRDDIRRFFERSDAVAAVTIASVKGSTPRDTDAWMLVSAGRTFGTIGGGQLEFMAIDAARVLLGGEADTQTMDIPLGPEIGQCCGGRVILTIDRLDRIGRTRFIERMDAEVASRPSVYLFGAGHVGNALAAALRLLPLRPVLADSRPDALADAPDGVEISLTALPEMIVREAEPGSAFVILTHDHALDFLIAREALLRGDARYVGMIGSATKRAAFERWYADETGSKSGLKTLISPIGNTECADKRPEAIASFVAAEIMEHLSEAPKKQDKKRARKAAMGDFNER